MLDNYEEELLGKAYLAIIQMCNVTATMPVVQLLESGNFFVVFSKAVIPVDYAIKSTEDDYLFNSMCYFLWSCKLRLAMNTATCEGINDIAEVWTLPRYEKYVRIDILSAKEQREASAATEAYIYSSN